MAPRSRYKQLVDAGEPPSFLPVEVLPGPALAQTPEVSPGRVEIVLPSGHGVSTSGSFGSEVRCRVVGVLAG